MCSAAIWGGCEVVAVLACHVQVPHRPGGWVEVWAGCDRLGMLQEAAQWVAELLLQQVVQPLLEVGGTHVSVSGAAADFLLDRHV